jgi:uncharacterized RDD family membrane protein YckC
MGCPQCESNEISPSGVCLICGYQIPADSSAEQSKIVKEEPSSHSGAIEVDYAEGAPESPEKEDLPPWRQELSDRLSEIKKKREAVSAGGQEGKNTSASPAQTKPVETLSVLQARLAEKMPARKIQPPLVPPPRQRPLEPLVPETPPANTSPRPADRAEVQNLIDSVISRQLSNPVSPSGIAKLPRYEPIPDIEQEGKLILLSRTLSGLVDWIVIVLCTGLFIIAADYFSGIIVLDHISLIDFSALFLLNYFLYSFFFLAASNQTIGMMITDLRVVGPDLGRPTMNQILRRCFVYLASLLVLGIGLLLSLFDRENLCFHDRHSGTHVIRL